MDVSYIKALHIIFVITWFAGLFYVVRLFVYHAEANKRPETERDILQAQYKIMEFRLWYYIAWPSMILAVFFGSWLAVEMFSDTFSRVYWLLLKLGLVFGLVLYHLRCHTLFKALQRDQNKRSGTWFRMWNEVATLFLIAIVFLAVLKNTTNWLWGLLGLVIIAGLMMMVIRIYKKRRERKRNPDSAGEAPSKPAE